MHAILAVEPYNLRPWEIAKLTRVQIVHLYFRPRNDDGTLVRREAEPAVETTFVGMFREVWRKRGRTDAQIDLLWEEYLVENPGLKELTELGYA